MVRKQRKSFSETIDAFTLKIPLLGKIKYKISLARAFETFSLLLIAGVPMLTVIELAADAAGNFKVKEKFLELRSGVERGKKLNEIANEKKLFPPIVCQMINVGEKTGRTPQMLSKIAEWYNNELAETIKRLSMLMEPIMIIIVGIIIGFLVFSVFMPVISAANTYL